MKNFDYFFYINYYADLKKNKINDYASALKHYKTNGIKENRYYSTEHSKLYYEYSWLLYKEKNIDLKNYVKNEKEAFEHYMKYGKIEKREIYPIEVSNIEKFNWDLFDDKFYNEINHLNLNNRKDSMKHFKNIGRKLNLMYSTKFSHLYYNYDWNRYILENDDLSDNTNIKEAFFHYLDYGKQENRIIYKKDDIESKLKIFNWKFYLDFNNDLILNNILNKEKSIKHFKSTGYKENRLYSHYHYLLYINYDWNRYSTMYKLNLSDKESLKFYLSNGIKMNHKIFHKISKHNFYTDFFKSINDLDDLNNFEQCKKYYLKLENKIPYSYEHYLIYILFDWEKIYLSNEEYLKTLEIDSTKKFFIEYLNNFDKYKIKLILNENLDTIYNFENIDNLFCNSSLIASIINFNLINNDQDFIINLISIQDKLNSILSFNFNFITIPPGYEFNDYYYKSDKLFTFVISSFNNQENIYNNLLSIIYQNCKNWKIYYTDDASTDNTEELFFEIISKYNIIDKVVHFKNEVNMKQSYCKNKTYKYLNNFDIVLLLDGDDWLAKNNVLSLLGAEYDKPENNLIIYSGYHVYYDNKINKSIYGNEYPEKVKNEKSYRTHPGWLFTHLKTGYAWLFKKIPDEYFMYENNWLDRCTDLAEMYSASELAGRNVKHLKEILYVYNKQNSLKYNTSYYNDYDSEKRKSIENYVKGLRPLNLYLPKIYIINLKNRTDLKEIINKQFNLLEIKNYEFFEATNGYVNQSVKDKYEEYDLKYKNNLISKLTLGVSRKHINSYGALGVIYSTIKLYKKINENKNINHVIILEDDIYVNKNFKNFYQILNTDLYDKDYIYLGFNSTSNKLNKYINIKNPKLIEINNENFKDITIYGAYSYICSKKYRDFIISLGIDFFINNNVNLDAAINIYLGKDENKIVKNDLKFYIYSVHLFIPEVRKNGINQIRNNDFYIERSINLDNYLI